MTAAQAVGLFLPAEAASVMAEAGLGLFGEAGTWFGPGAAQTGGTAVGTGAGSAGAMSGLFNMAFGGIFGFVATNIIGGIISSWSNTPDYADAMEDGLVAKYGPDGAVQAGMAMMFMPGLNFMNLDESSLETNDPRDDERGEYYRLQQKLAEGTLTQEQYDVKVSELIAERQYNYYRDFIKANTVMLDMLNQKVTDPQIANIQKGYMLDYMQGIMNGTVDIQMNEHDFTNGWKSHFNGSGVGEQEMWHAIQTVKRMQKTIADPEDERDAAKATHYIESGALDNAKSELQRIMDVFRSYAPDSHEGLFLPVFGAMTTYGNSEEYSAMREEIAQKKQEASEPVW
jgi:hypothetical protein